MQIDYNCFFLSRLQTSHCSIVSAKVFALAFNENGQSVACANSIGDLYILDPFRSESRSALKMSQPLAANVLVFKDSETLMSGGDDGIVRSWDTRNGGSVSQEFHGHAGPVKNIEIVSAEYFLTGSFDGDIRLRKFSDPSFSRTLLRHPNLLRFRCISCQLGSVSLVVSLRLLPWLLFITLNLDHSPDVPLHLDAIVASAPIELLADASQSPGIPLHACCAHT